MINGEAFDAYAPRPNTSTKSIWNEIKKKTLNQAQRIVLNLDDSKFNIDDLKSEITEKEYKKRSKMLKEMLVIKNGKITRFDI